MTYITPTLIDISVCCIFGYLQGIICLYYLNLKLIIKFEFFSRSSRSSSSGGLKRHNARRDAKRVPYKFQKDRRAKFKSTEDLIHRLYVCISGAADQLQSNYAADFRYEIIRQIPTKYVCSGTLR